MKSDQHNYGPTEPIAWHNILLNQSGIKTAFYWNTEINDSCNNRHDDQKLLYPF